MRKARTARDDIGENALVEHRRKGVGEGVLVRDLMQYYIRNTDGRLVRGRQKSRTRAFGEEGASDRW